MEQDPKGYYRDEKGILKNIKVVINCRKSKPKKGNGGFICSAHFTYMTSAAKTKEDAIRFFVERLKLRNYEVNEK